ncbi:MULTISPECIES: hypothetical protein [unclassified Streptomyces]|uniref:hypothetical protein n=1 Tax=unclassified Streptomyces TaxID=2593676 RepID=UPI002DDA5655|nr:hypothetical protein [Streptomyces sp. NBC_01294]WRZ55141.1 hypothetical protein OG534_00560 [Streptomyces sp. NBC_01294]WRZ61562.1 hypothetical protein OG534_36920 [Streptomyces sp. NBC_01294]
MKIIIGVAIGALFGVATSLVNTLSSPYLPLGASITGTVLAGAAKVLSLLMDSGWAWAALAVATGWLARTWARGALTGALALIAATAAYYVMDSSIRGEPLAWYESELTLWWAASVLFGTALGAVGAAIRRPGTAGLLAALTVPVGAAAQMLLMPPRPHMTLTPGIILAEVIVWTGAALGAGWAVYRFRAERRA